ncbi:phospholipid/cholesterol/gamma-HCH transport system substrate-binding protein [Collimonas sp. OK607]|nr:phospholipid/cholesterol/gamma-HCH transport system substrate-binding protein [Collimonas sp. OK607]
MPCAAVLPPLASFAFLALLLLVLLAALVCGFLLYVLCAGWVFLLRLLVLLMWSFWVGLLVGMGLLLSGFPLLGLPCLCVALGGTSLLLISVLREDATWLCAPVVFLLCWGLVVVMRVFSFRVVVGDALLPAASDRALVCVDLSVCLAGLVASARGLLIVMAAVPWVSSRVRTRLLQMLPLAGWLVG